MQDYTYIKNNLYKVRSLAESAAIRAGVKMPKLIAVTKSASDEEVMALAGFGIEAIGENRTTLFNSRYDLLKDKFPQMEFHLIGHLQTNKVKYIADKATLIHSLDSLRLASEIEKQGAKHGIKIPVLIEVNSGREEAKSGVLPEDILSFHESLSCFEHLSICGLMTMAPRCSSREEYLKYFKLTREIFDELFKDEKDAVLSMGMSESYEYAIEAGANLVRVGSAVFGERKYI